MGDVADLLLQFRSLLAGFDGLSRGLVLLPLFAAAIVGGMSSPYGAFAGALAIGVAAEVSTEWIDPSYRPAVAFAVLIVVLLVLPRGIFGVRGAKA